MDKHRRPLLERLYADVANPDGLGTALGEIAARFGAHVAALHAEDVENRCASVPQAAGISVGEIVDYETRFASENIFVRQALPVLLETGFATDAVIPDAELRRSVYFNEYMRRIDVRYTVGMVIANDPGRATAMASFLRGESHGPFDASEQHRLQRLLPHLRNAYALQRRLSQAERRADGYRAALDRVAFGVLLLDRRGKPAFSNTAAQALCAEIGLHIASRRVTTPWRADQPLLQAAIDKAIAGLASTTPSSMQIRDRTGTPVALLSLSPVPPPALAPWAEYNIAAVAFLHPIQPRSAGAADMLRKTFRLSRAEAELACRLHALGNLHTCAEEMGKSVNTLRSQLRIAFAKTGTRRQADLIRLVEVLGTTSR